MVKASLIDRFFNETNSTSSFSSSSSSSSPTKETCEQIFNLIAPKNCSQCQNTIYQAESNSSGLDGCSTFLNIQRSVDQNIETFLEDSCTNNHCNTTLAQELLKQIDKDCSSELKAYINSIDSENYDMEDPNGIVAGIWGRLYISTPVKQSLCQKNFKGGYCVPDIQAQINQSLTTNQSALNGSIVYSITPPDSSVSYYTSQNQTRVTTMLPKNILCSECYTKISQSWIDYINKNPPENGIMNKQIELAIQPVKGNLTALCNIQSSNGFRKIDLTFINQAFIGLISFIIFSTFAC
ncbi:hypothetical protein G9A89_009855 [Geosiphon pyriformis]|nr:hypothetical protein G9A89_009855 [Geosiphon pyriformis]